MAQPLRLFIRNLSAGPDGPWSLVHGYGDDVNGSARPFAFIETSGNATLYAATSGRLSVIPPYDPCRDFFDLNAVPSMWNIVPPETLTLYLSVSPRQMLGMPAAGPLRGFVYLNVETKSIESSLAECLDWAGLPPTAASSSQKLLCFARGLLDVWVSAGHAIGKAAPWQGSTAKRRAGFSALYPFPEDPAYAFDSMRDLFEEPQTDVDALLNLIPKRWPVLNPALPATDILTLCGQRLYPMTTLRRLKEKLTPSEWRQLGNNQKRLWRQRLFKRAGWASPMNVAPPFEFDDLDWENIFQLEAVVEFYMNYPDPWSGHSPRIRENPAPSDPIGDSLTGTAAVVTGHSVTLDGSPDLTRVVVHHDFLHLDADSARPSRTYRIIGVDAASSRVTVDAVPTTNSPSPWRIDLFRTVDFLVPSGNAATSVGNVVKLDGQPDLSRIRVHHDIITFAGLPTSFLITGIDLNAHTVTLAASPNLSSPSGWSIAVRPALVLIDPFGPRRQGKTAIAVSGAPKDLKLSDAEAGIQVSASFDTLYLPANTGLAHASRAFRIEGIKNGPIVTLDVDPAVGPGEQQWHIQCGIGGSLPDVDYTFNDYHGGADHYDGVLFVVYDGAVRGRFRWTSFSSWINGKTGEKSRSIRGNRSYTFESRRADTKNWINHAFIIREFGAELSSSDDPVLQGARHYYASKVTEGTQHAIFIHDGNRGDSNSSEGCLVSCRFYALRKSLIDIQQTERQRLGLGTDPVLERLRFDRKTLEECRTEAKRLFNTNSVDAVSNNDWASKINGTLWLVRPDEKPLS